MRMILLISHTRMCTQARGFPSLTNVATIAKQVQKNCRYVRVAKPSRTAARHVKFATGPTTNLFATSFELGSYEDHKKRFLCGTSIRRIIVSWCHYFSLLLMR